MAALPMHTENWLSGPFTAPSAAGARQLQDQNPLHYPRSRQLFSKELFQKPTSEYRGCPVWSWTGALDPDRLVAQVDDFAAMGMGGFHVQPRDGLDADYLGPEFVEVVKKVIEKAREKNLLVGLSDEDRGPSGSGGGRVLLDHPEFRQLHLLLTPTPYGQSSNR
jgi:hypothetical protein